MCSGSWVVQILDLEASFNTLAEIMYGPIVWQLVEHIGRSFLQIDSNQSVRFKDVYCRIDLITLVKDSSHPDDNVVQDAIAKARI